MSSLSSRALFSERLSGRSPYVASLDIGSSKVACLIARRSDCIDGYVQVSGAGHQVSKGVKNGQVVDMAALERSIRVAVEQAERSAGAEVSEIVIGVSGPKLKNQIISAEIDIGRREITDSHLQEVQAAALESFTQTNQEIAHASVLSYSVDDSDGIKNPEGMFARSLGVRMLLVHGPDAVLRNLAQCISRAHLTPTAMVDAAYASGLSVLVDDEFERGATVIDIGGRITSLASFYDGRLVSLDRLNAGGNHASADLSQGLGTTFAAAERIKTLYGAVSLTEIAAFELVDAPRLGADGRLEAAEASRSEIAQILRPRFEEILEIMAERLAKACQADRPLSRRIILTGGASQLPGMREVAESIFNSPVRMARPSARITGLGEAYETPAFAAAAGLLRWEIMGRPGFQPSSICAQESEVAKGFFERATLWLRQNV